MKDWIMWNIPVEQTLFKKFGKHAKIAGVIFVLLGIAGIAFPPFMTMTTVVFVSWLLLFAGISAAIFTWQTDREDWMGWLKAFALILVALYMLFFPIGGAATVGLLLSIYFFTDAFAGFGLAMNMRPAQGWWVWLLNAVLSLVLGVLFVIGWPFSSLYLVGIFVGISLLFDGIALIMGGKFMQKLDDDLK